MSARCYKCKGPTQPAQLNPKHLWCTICAEELNLSGGPLTPSETPAPIQVARGEPATQTITKEDPAKEASDFPPHVFPHNMGETPKTFRVTIGSVSFVATARTELAVGKSRILIELL